MPVAFKRPRWCILRAVCILQSRNYASISEYLNTCYTDGFIGTFYDLQGQKIPLAIPIDQTKTIKAVEKTADGYKLSTKLKGNTAKLKQQVQAEISRGIASEMPYAKIARNIANHGEADMNRAMRIARTEGGRIQESASLDAAMAAKDKGADVVKQWDATFDSKTRPHHAQLDGQIRELDEPFEINGKTAMHPLGFGDPSEDCNCRCKALKIARWIAEDDEYIPTKWNNETSGLVKCKNYKEFKEKYLQGGSGNTVGARRQGQTSGFAALDIRPRRRYFVNKAATDGSAAAKQKLAPSTPE